MREIVAVVLWAGIPFCWQPLWGQAPSVRVEKGKEPKGHADSKKDATQKAERGTAEVPFVVDTEGHKQTPEEAEKAKAARDQAAYVEGRTLLFAGIAAYATTVLVFIGLGGVIAALRTLWEIERNTTAFIHSQRPWISVETAIASPLVYDDHGAHITIIAALKNVGQMPAIGVWVDPLMYIQAPNKPTADDERVRMCGDIPKRTKLGRVAFPGETVHYCYQISAPGSEIEASCRAIFGDAASEAKMYSAKVILAVAYRTAIDKETCYHTAPIYDLDRIEGALGALIIGESIPMESLRLSLSVIAGIIAD